ncbi:hypothetical protein [Aurantivibrio plasticivorans]
MRLFVLVLFSLMLTACGESTPTDTAESYWQSVLNGEEIKRQLLVSDQRERGVESYFDPNLDSTVHFEQAVIEGQQARVMTHLSIEEASGTAHYTTPTYLVQQDGEWKVRANETRKAFIKQLFTASLGQLQDTLSESAEEFRKMGEEFAQVAATEINEAAEQLQEDAEQASDDVEKFLQQLDKTLVEELKKYAQENP